MTGPARKRRAPSLRSELAGTDGERGHKEKLRLYGQAKAHQEAVRLWIIDHDPGLAKEAERMAECSSWLVFRHFFQVDKYRLIGGCTCRQHLLCAMCALRRSAKMVRAYEAKIRAVLADNPGLVPVLVTLTVRNGEDLAERFRHLEDKYKRMIRNRQRCRAVGARHKTVFARLLGGVAAFEVKRGSGSGLWHPHLHMWALVPAGTDLLQFRRELSAEWQRLTLDSCNVDVRPIDASTDETFLGSICEVLRYALKFGEMTIPDQVTAYRVLKGWRLVRDFGLLHGVTVSDDLTDSIEEALELEPYLDLIYRYAGRALYTLDHVGDLGDAFTRRDGRPKRSRSRSVDSQLPVAYAGDRPVDQDYMDEWVADNIERINSEVPF